MRFPRRTVLALCVMAAALMSVSTPAQAQLLSGLDRTLGNLLGQLGLPTTRVIVRTERGLLNQVVRLLPAIGGVVNAEHRFIDSVTITLPLRNLQLLVRLPGVLHVSTDVPVYGPAPGESGTTLPPAHLVTTLGLDRPDPFGREVDGRGFAAGPPATAGGDAHLRDGRSRLRNLRSSIRVRCRNHVHSHARAADDSRTFPPTDCLLHQALLPRSICVCSN